MCISAQEDGYGDTLKSEYSGEVYSGRGVHSGAQNIYKTNIRVPVHTKRVAHRGNKLAFSSEGECSVLEVRRGGEGSSKCCARQLTTRALGRGR